jgi:hypothetical protein
VINEIIKTTGSCNVKGISDVGILIKAETISNESRIA